MGWLLGRRTAQRGSGGPRLRRQASTWPGIGRGDRGRHRGREARSHSEGTGRGNACPRLSARGRRHPPHLPPSLDRRVRPRQDGRGGRARSAVVGV